MELLSTLTASVTANWAPIAATMVVCWKVRGWLYAQLLETRYYGRMTIQNTEQLTTLVAAHSATGERLSHVEARVDVLDERTKDL